MAAKILIIAGPNRGATYFLSEGSNTIGRDPSCTIVLSSEKVSKRHCELIASNGGRNVELSDLGSSNGTFVNGVLAKRKALRNSDKISIGPFVVQVFLQPSSKVKLSSPNFSTASTASIPNFENAAPGISLSVPQPEEPTSLLARLKKRFDEIVLPVMYGFYEKHDFPSIFIGMFVVFMVLSVGFSVSPILEQTHEEVFREAKARAIYIARQMALLNRQALMEGKESLLNVDFAESDLNVRDHVLINLDMRIMAPATHMNEMFNNTTVLRFKDNLLKDPKNWEIPYTVKTSPDGEKITVMVPVMVLSKEKGINVPGAIAVVVFSTSHLALDSGTEAAIYFETFFTMAMLGTVFLYLLYQLTFQPIRLLNDDIDKVLKGEAESVEKRYRSEMINALIDTVNSALSRISKASSSSDTGASLGEQEQIVTDNFMRHLEQMAGKLTIPVMILDVEERIKYLNSAFEELTGIRGAVGELIESVSRDESFPSLVREMMGKSKDLGSEGVLEDYDFNSGLHKIHCVALISLPGKTEGFMFHFEKVEG